MKIIRKLTPAQALAEANRRYDAAQWQALRERVAADLARLIAALPKK